MKFGYWILMAIADFWQAAVTKSSVSRALSITGGCLALFVFALSLKRTKKETA